MAEMIDFSPPNAILYWAADYNATRSSDSQAWTKAVLGDYTITGDAIEFEYLGDWDPAYNRVKMQSESDGLLHWHSPPDWFCTEHYYGFRSELAAHFILTGRWEQGCEQDKLQGMFCAVFPKKCKQDQLGPECTVAGTGIALCECADLDALARA